MERLDEARIANARMRTVQDFLEHPQLEVRSPDCSEMRQFRETS